MDPTFGLPHGSIGPIGVHAGVWGFAWDAGDAARTLRRAVDSGFDFVEIPASPAAIADPSTTHELLTEYGLGATVSLALDDSTDIHTEDPELAAAGEQRLVHAVDYAARIGAPFLGGVIHSAMTRYRALPTQAAREAALGVLDRVAEHAARVGVTLGVEYVNRYESNLLNTAAQTVAFIEELGRDNVVLHLDTFHAHVEEVSVPHAIATGSARLGYVHASESHRGALGTGALEWDSIVRALEGIGFAGPVTVETFSPAVVSADQAIEIGLWRTLWADPDAIARESARFLRTQFAGTAPESPHSPPLSKELS